MRKILSGILIIILLSTQAQSTDCYQTEDIRDMDPEFRLEPLYWNKDIRRGFQVKIVRIPGEEELFYNLNYCSDGTRPVSGTELTEFENCQYISDLWLPLNRLEDPGHEGNPATVFFRDEVSRIVEEKASDMRMDPALRTGLEGIHGLYFTIVGVAMYAFATVHKPVTRRGKFGRWLGRFTGVSLVAITAWNTYSRSRTRFSDERNQLRVELDNLVAQIDADAALRLDGQDQDRHMSMEAMDHFVEALTRAASTTQNRYCSDQAPL